MSAVFVPDAVWAEVRRYTEGMGGPEPVVEMIRPQTWRFLWDDGRVRLHIDFRSHGRGRVRWMGSRLYIDGVEREKLAGVSRFRILWGGGTYEEAAAHQLPKRPYAPSPIEDEAPFDEAPPAVRASLDKLVDSYGGAVRYGRTGDVHVLAVDLDDEQRAMRFWLQGNSLIVKPVRIELWIDGEDVTSLVGNDIAKAMALLRAAPPGSMPPSGGPPVAHAAAAKGFTAPDVRRGTVIRT